MSGPLQGLKVLDVGNMIAGPMSATLLADLGAEVIKIEHPVHGDPLRDWEPKKEGLSLWWKVLNRNKSLITLDLKQPAGLEILKTLVARSDVLIENFRAGTLERWGITEELLKELNPDLVVVRISGYGQTGPHARKPGYGTIAESMSGIPHFTGPRDAPPTLPGFPMADAVTAVFGAFSALAGLFERAESGKGGQAIDVSLFETLFRLVDSQVIGYDQLGKVKQRNGNRLEEDAPRNTYPTRDGHWIAISASSNKTWRRLAKAMGRIELIDDPRFATSSDRVANVDALDAYIQEWFSTLDLEAALQVIEEMDIVGGRVMDIEDIFADPQYKAREAIVDVPDEDFEQVRMQAVVPKFNRTPGAVHRSGGHMGVDNDAVYGRLLGMSEDDLRQLREQVVI